VRRVAIPRRRAERRTDLLRLLPPASVGCEIGVWKGDFSRELIRALRPRRLHLVDPWRFAGDTAHSGSLYGGLHARSQADMEEIYGSVRQRFRTWIRAGVVVVHRVESPLAASEFPDGYFDWVYVDGDHLYDRVLADLRAFEPKVRVGGFIAGDDYADAGWWQGGVRKAVDEFVATGGVEVVALGDQFVLRRGAAS
jgi:hypothetical protein